MIYVFTDVGKISLTTGPITHKVIACFCKSTTYVISLRAVQKICPRRVGVRLKCDKKQEKKTKTTIENNLTDKSNKIREGKEILEKKNALTLDAAKRLCSVDIFSVQPLTHD